MTVIQPDGHRDVNVPDQPAKVTGVRPNLPEDFNQGDIIALQIDLDRPLTALECRVMDEKGPSSWQAFSGHDVMTVELTRVDQDTLSQVQDVLDEANAVAAEEARKADETRSLLSRLIADWGL